MPARWSVQVYNDSFVNKGEVNNLHELKLDVPLNKIRTCQLKVRLDNILAGEMVYSAAPRYIKIYRNERLLFFGPIITAQESGTEDQKATLQINASGPEIIFTQRLIQPEGVPPYTTASGIKAPAGVQRAVQFKELLKWSNERGSAVRGETHIDFTTGPIECANTEAYEAPAGKLLSEILSEMYNQAAGFDWMVEPIEVTGFAPNLKIGRLRIQQLISTSKPNAVFEYGGGLSNIASYTRTIDGTNLLNLGYNISSGGWEATGAPEVHAQDIALQEIWGLREGMVSANILNAALRQTLTDETVAVRKYPRQTITFTPVPDNERGNLPVLGTDYNVGDTVRGRIVYEGSTRLDLTVRVWAASFALDENGKETQTLTLSDS